MIIIFEILIISNIIIMSIAFEDFKKLKIKNITNIYNQNIYSLTLTYNNIIRQIINNRKLRNKVNIYISEYNNKINILKNKYNNDIISIKNIIQPIIQKIINKSALLIGINYLNTENELQGCINDVNNIYDLLHLCTFKTPTF